MYKYDSRQRIYTEPKKQIHNIYLTSCTRPDGNFALEQLVIQTVSYRGMHLDSHVSQIDFDVRRHCWLSHGHEMKASGMHVPIAE